MSVKYRGITFPGYNKPKASNREGKKKMVLAKKNKKIKKKKIFLNPSQDGKSAVRGKSVDFGGRRILKKKKN